MDAMISFTTLSNKSRTEKLNHPRRASESADNSGPIPARHEKIVSHPSPAQIHQNRQTACLPAHPYPYPLIGQRASFPPSPRPVPGYLPVSLSNDLVHQLSIPRNAAK